MGVFATVNSSPSGIQSKSTDNSKSMMSLREGAAEDREEGEIIEEYEDIISSDEEFSMRQRIEELEAKNAELEKIANISAIYASGNYDYPKKDLSAHHADRYPLISINISDEEDYPPAASMTRNGKRRKSLQHSSSSRRKMLHPSNASSHRRRKKSSSSPPPPPPYRPSDKLLLSMFHEKCAARTSSKKRRKNKKSHSAKEPRRMREYQYISDDYTLDTYNLDVEDGYENYNSSDAGTSFSLNRDELRLALARNTHRHEQHVSLKDRLIRRKENTDTLNEKNADDVHEVVEVEDVSDSPPEKADIEDSMEEQELRIIALKSAVIRKHLVRKKRNENAAYSPSDFDGTYANVSISPSINIDDAEPCMEISPVPSPKLVVSDDDGIDTKPVDMDIANSDSECELSYEKWVPIEQIPLPSNTVMHDDLYVPTPMRYGTNVEHQHFMPPDVRLDTALESPAHLESDVEEEELALRALLLAKMNSPKVNKNVVEERPKLEERYSPDADTSLEAEALRNFLISNMKKKTKPQNSSASVLKEAVRRLTARNSNSPMERFAENKCQTVSAFSMSLHDAENQLSRSTADLAKIQIGQGGIRRSNVGQGWGLWSSDDGYGDVKFHLSPKGMKVEGMYPTEGYDERSRGGVLCIENLQSEGSVKDLVVPDVDEREFCRERQKESECLTIKSKTFKNEVEEKNLTQTESLVQSPAKQDRRCLGVEDDRKDSVEVIEDCVRKDERELSGTVPPIETERQIEPETTEAKSADVAQDKEQPNVGTSVQPKIKSPLSDTILKADKAFKPAAESETKSLSDAKKKISKNAQNVSKSSMTEDVEKVKESSTQKETKIIVKDVNLKTSVSTKDKNSHGLATQKDIATDKHKSVKIVVRNTKKSVDAGNQAKIQGVEPTSVTNSVPAEAMKSCGGSKPLNIPPSELKSPPQNKSVAEKKKISSVDASKVVKATIPSSQVKVVEKLPIAQQKKDVTDLEKPLPIGSVIGGKENTVFTNSSAAKFQPKPEKHLIGQSLTTKPPIQRTQQSHPKPPGQQATKIVKPNKVINTRTTELKRPPTENPPKPAVPSKVAKLDESSNRLITAAEMPQVKKLVIQLRASDSESEYSALSAEGEDDDDDLEARDRDFLNRSITIGNEYYDIASPISLPMESPCDTPTRIASPITSVTPQQSVEKSIVNDFFEAQLDKFLKNVRSQVAESSKKPVEVKDSASAVSTPVAVRHLPEASQQEYRRLINRMKMLERQKQAKNLQVIVKNTTVVTSPETRIVMGEGESLVRKVLVKNASVSTAKPTFQMKIPLKPALQKQKPTESGESIEPNIVDAHKTSIGEVNQKPKIPEKADISSSVVPKNIQSALQTVPSLPTKSASTALKSAPSQPGSSPPKQSNQKLLVLYEKTYRETGNSIISNLDRSIEMVMVAKKAKMEKLKHEYRLMELRKEMEEVQRKIRQQQERITKIYPEICNSHRMIETLKTRRAKIHKDVTAFGKRVIGQSYSMNNDQKPIISEKSKKLVAEIKFVNNMKLHDVEKCQPPTRPTSSLNASATEAPPVQKPITENDSLACPTNDIVPVDDNKTNAASKPFLPDATSRIEPELTHTVVPEKVLNEPKTEENQTEQDQKNATNGHEEALENEEPVTDDKEVHNSNGDKEEKKEEEEKLSGNNDDNREEDSEVCGNEHVGGTKLQDYVSPLGHLRDERQINPNGIVCPYQLMGQCGDKDCKYMHLDN